jgi:hypothetical protein
MKLNYFSSKLLKLSAKEHFNFLQDIFLLQEKNFKKNCIKFFQQIVAIIFQFHKQSKQFNNIKKFIKGTSFLCRIIKAK